jgi:outer membrane receptor protein involved in Fe transport
MSRPLPSPFAFRSTASCRRLAAAALLLVTLEAHAQSIDYGALEQLFGEPVTTSATGAPQRASDVPANMVIITQEDIRRSGADNIPDVLQYVAGIDVRQYSSSQSDVSVRGYDQQYSPRLLVLVNGRQVYVDDYGYTAWQTLPVQLDEIRQIEIVKGPSSALFGFNAVGGVINIVTCDPLYDRLDEVTVRSGTDGYRAASAVGTLQTGKRAGLRLSAGASQADEFSTASLPAVLGPYDTPPHQFSASADGRVEATDRVELTAEATVSQAKGLGAVPVPSFITADYHTNSGKIGLIADTSAGLIDARAYRDHFEYAVAELGQQFLVDDDLDVLQASDLFRPGPAHTLRVGLEYRSGFASGLGPHDVGDRIYGANGMWSWKLTPGLALTNSVRVDRLQMSFRDSILPLSQLRGENDKGDLSAFSFNSGLVYTPTAVDTVRVLVARGAQAPSLADLGLQTQYQTPFGLRVTYSGNPDLRPATVVNYEVNYDRALSALESMVRTAIYYEDIHDVLADALSTPLSASPGGLFSYSQNVGESSAAGGEIELQGRDASGLRWKASYARISISQRLTLGPFSSSSDLLDYAHGTPASVVDAGIGYGVGHVEGSLEGRWQSRFTDYRPNETDVVMPFPVDSYLTVSARLAYRFGENITASVSGEQLGRARLFEAAGTPVERRVYATLSASF